MESLNNIPEISVWKQARNNFIYGFLGNAVVGFMIFDLKLAIFINLFFFYFFLGEIVSRPKKITKLAKFLTFPLAAALGGYLGYEFSKYVELLIQ